MSATALAAPCQRDRNVAARYHARCLDDLEYGMPLAGAKVEGDGVSSVSEVIQRQDVSPTHPNWLEMLKMFSPW